MVFFLVRLWVDFMLEHVDDVGFLDFYDLIVYHGASHNHLCVLNGSGTAAAY